MPFEHLFEPQSRAMERTMGWLALAAGLFAVGFAFWLPFQDPGRSPVGFTRGLALFTGLLGLYCIAIAWRLLGPTRPRYLVSPLTLAILGTIMAAGAAVQIVWLPRTRWGAVDGLVLAGACWVLGWRRYRLERAGAAGPVDTTGPAHTAADVKPRS